MTIRCLMARKAGVVMVIIGMAFAAAAGSLQPVSVVDATLGPSTAAAGDSLGPILSTDGRFVLFASRAGNLVALGTNSPIPSPTYTPVNVYLRDRLANTTTLVSINLAGTGGGNDNSWPVAVSTNGQYVLFESSASDLVPGDTNNATDVFLRDMTAGTTTLISAGTNGAVGNGASKSSDMTPDGRFVAFVSAASNLVAGDTNGIPDVFVRDVATGVTVLASPGAKAVATTPPSGASASPLITPDGRFVAFYSSATNLVPDVTTASDIYVRDLAAGTTTWASAGARAALGAGTVNCFNHSISDDGQFVAYEAASSSSSSGSIFYYHVASGMTELVHANAGVGAGLPEDIRSLDMTPDGRYVAFMANTNGTTGNTTCILVWDSFTETMALASGSPSNAVQPGSLSDSPVLDASGRFVAFVSGATNLVAGGPAGDVHYYLRDLTADTTAIVDVKTNGLAPAIDGSAGPAMSANGRLLAFACLDTDLAPGDRNRAYDVFLRNMGAGTAEMVSARDASLPSLTGTGSSGLSSFSVTSDGRLVAFWSEADDLVANDANRCRDVFVRDVKAGTNLLISVNTNGVAADSISTDPTITPDGRYVAFVSSADDLVPRDSNKAQDVFVRDLQGGTTTLVSVNNTGIGTGNYSSYSPMISADGRYVLFRSKATDLVRASVTGTENLFMRDLQTATTYALTTGGVYNTPVMTPNGRFVAFSAKISSTNPDQLYIWDTQAAARIYTNDISWYYGSGGALAISPDGNRLAYWKYPVLYVADFTAKTNNPVVTNVHFDLSPSAGFSSDGRFLVYSGYPGNLNLHTNHVYLYDAQSRSNLLISQDFRTGAGGNANSDMPTLSPDGRFVAFRSRATNLVPGDTNGLADIFLYDRLSGSMTLLSASLFGQRSANGQSASPVFSGDGMTLFFQSWASDLAASDFNSATDIIACNFATSGTIQFFSAQLILGAAPGQGPTIIWPALPGKMYRVQYKDNLNDAWQDLPEAITLLGGQAALNDTTASSNQRFYRIIYYP